MLLIFLKVSGDSTPTPYVFDAGVYMSLLRDRQLVKNDEGGASPDVSRARDDDSDNPFPDRGYQIFISC